MTLQEQSKLAGHIMRLLKVRQVSFPVANTEKGPLSLKYTKDQTDYDIVLDAVILPVKSIVDDESNIELKKMLEKYAFDKEPEEKALDAAVIVQETSPEIPSTEPSAPEVTLVTEPNPQELGKPDALAEGDGTLQAPEPTQNEATTNEAQPNTDSNGAGI